MDFRVEIEKKNKRKQHPRYTGLNEFKGQVAHAGSLEGWGEEYDEGNEDDDGGKKNAVCEGGRKLSLQPADGTFWLEWLGLRLE